MKKQRTTPQMYHLMIWETGDRPYDLGFYFPVSLPANVAANITSEDLQVTLDAKAKAIAYLVARYLANPAKAALFREVQKSLPRQHANSLRQWVGRRREPVTFAAKLYDPHGQEFFGLSSEAKLFNAVFDLPPNKRSPKQEEKLFAIATL